MKLKSILKMLVYSFVPFSTSGGYVGYFSYYNIYIYPIYPWILSYPIKPTRSAGRGQKKSYPESLPTLPENWTKKGDERQANLERMSSECEANVRK